MLESVNFNTQNYGVVKKAQNQNNSVFDNSASDKSRQNIAFGYRDVYRDEDRGIFSGIKNGIVNLTDDIVGLVGVNAALWFMQDFVNSKILVGKINKHYTKNLPDNDKLWDLAQEMKKNEGGLNNLSISEGKSGQAYYSHLPDGDLPANRVVVGKDSYSSLFHEIGHAKIENKSILLKGLQRFRGRYTILSLALYGLLSQNKDGNSDRNDYIIPLLAFSPELITEGMASHHGLKFLREKVKNKELDMSAFKKIKKSYITCFGTYLFIPVSIMLIDAIRNSARKARAQRQMQRQMSYYSY